MPYRIVVYSADELRQEPRFDKDSAEFDALLWYCEKVPTARIQAHVAAGLSQPRLLLLNSAGNYERISAAKQQQLWIEYCKQLKHARSKYDDDAPACHLYYDDMQIVEDGVTCLDCIAVVNYKANPEADAMLKRALAKEDAYRQADRARLETLLKH